MKQEVSIAKIIFTLIAGLYLLNCMLSPGAPHVIDTINLIFHEAGHSILRAGDLVTATAGSLFQVLIPLVCGIYFLARGEYYSAMIVFMWMAQSMANVSAYVGDAVTMRLPLLGGDSVTHDWNYALSVTNLIPYTEKIARGIYIVAMTIFGISALIALRLSYGEPKIKEEVRKYDWMGK